MWCQAEAEGLELRTRFLLRVVSVNFVQVHSIFNAELGYLELLAQFFLNKFKKNLKKKKG